VRRHRQDNGARFREPQSGGDAPSSLVEVRVGCTGARAAAAVLFQPFPSSAVSFLIAD
jgi:hypothetical protein